MAYGKRYYSSYKSNNNIDYYLEIFAKDFSALATEITLGEGGCVISYETLQIWITNYQALPINAKIYGVFMECLVVPKIRRNTND